MRVFTRIWCLLLMACLLAAPVAFAQRVEGDRAAAQGPYSAEVPVRNQTDAQRANGLSRALLKVLANVSGDRSPMGRQGVAEAVRNAKDYAAGYDYRQDEGRSATGAPTFQTMLVVRFVPSKVDQLIAQSGLASWPEPRPKPVLWMAIDDGSGPRLVGVGQANAARPVLDRAIARGYRLGLPSGSAAEQAVAGAIWRGDSAAVARASAAYRPPIQLLGKLYRNGPGWRADWIFVDSGRVLARSTTSNADARVAMAGGADIAADALIRKYARPGKPVAPKPVTPTNLVSDVTIEIVGIHGSDDYLRAMVWLDGQSAVKRIVPLEAAPDALRLRVSVSNGAEGLAKLAEAGGVLVGEWPSSQQPATPVEPANDKDGKPLPVAPPPPPTVYRVR